MEEDVVIKFVTKDKNRSFTLRKQELTLKRLSLFAAMDPMSICVRDHDGNEVLDLSKLVPTTTPYVVEQKTHVVENKWVSVCTVSDFEKQKNKINSVRVAVQGRDVMVVRLKKKKDASPQDEYYWRAMDAVCFHFGGPLVDGDIEDLPNGSCAVICPWHRYKINMDTGQSVHRAVDGSVMSSPKQMQRTHRVKEEDGQIWVFLDTSEEERPSDAYACMGLLHQ